MTRILLAGTGLIGRRHLAHVIDHPALTLAGIVDPDPEGRRLADVPGFAALEDVDVPVDGVVLATPTATHAPLACAALERGWPVLVEKPVAGTLEDAERIVAASRAAGLPVLVGHHRRHHPRFRALRDAVAGGRIGRPLAASVLWLARKPDDYFDAPWRAGADGAPVRQNVIHDVDLLRWLLGEVAEVATLPGPSTRGTARPETGGTVLRFDGGAVATLLWSDAAPSPWSFEAGTGENPDIAATGQDCLFVSGTEGAIAFPSLTLWSGSADWGEAARPIPLACGTGVPLVAQLEHFADVIAGRAAPAVDAASGRETLDVTLRIEAAA